MKRLLHAVFGLLAVACFALCLFALNWIWTVKKPAIEQTTYAFDQAEHWLNVADKAMHDVRGNLAVSQAMIVKTTPTPNAADGQNGFFEAMVARAAVKQIGPKVNDAQRTIDKVTEASIVVNSILDSLHDVPFDSREKLDAQQVTNLQSQLNDVTHASRKLGDMLDTPGNGENASAQSARVAAGLGEVIVMTAAYQERVQALQGRVQRVRNTTMYWMNLVPSLATIALAWIMISQLVVLMAAVKGMRRSGVAC